MRSKNTRGKFEKSGKNEEEEEKKKNWKGLTNANSPA